MTPFNDYEDAEFVIEYSFKTNDVNELADFARECAAASESDNEIFLTDGLNIRRCTALDFELERLSNDILEQQNLEFKDLAERFSVAIDTNMCDDGKTFKILTCPKCRSFGRVVRVCEAGKEHDWDSIGCHCYACGAEYMLYEVCYFCNNGKVKRICVDEPVENGMSAVYGVCESCDAFFVYADYTHMCGDDCMLEKMERGELVDKFAVSMKNRRKYTIARGIFGDMVDYYYVDGKLITER